MTTYNNLARSFSAKYKINKFKHISEALTWQLTIKLRKLQRQTTTKFKKLYLR